MNTVLVLARSALYSMITSSLYWLQARCRWRKRVWQQA